MTRVRKYDFARPVKLAPEQHQQVKRIFESFARRSGTRLSAHLRSLATIELIDVSQVSWADAIGAIDDPTITCVVHQDPGDSPVLMAMDLRLALKFVDRLLGGSRPTSDAVLASRTSLTDIELTLCAYTLEHLVDELTASWSAVVPVEYKLGDLRSDRQHALIAAPGDPAITVTLNIQIEDETDTLRLAIPWRALSAVADDLAKGYSTDDTSLNDLPMQETLGAVDVDVRVEVGHTNMTLAQVAELRPGAVLELTQAVTEGVGVWVEDAHCYKGLPGRDGDWRVVQVVEQVGNDDL